MAHADSRQRPCCCGASSLLQLSVGNAHPSPPPSAMPQREGSPPVAAMSGAGPLPSIDPFAVLAPPAPPPPMPVAHLAEAPLQPQQRRYTPPPPQQRFEPAETPGHYEDAADMTDAVQQSMDSGGGYVASDYDEGGGSGAKRDKRRHGADRRPLRFWQPFNDWWRSDLERLGRRPNAAEIQAWCVSARRVWRCGRQARCMLHGEACMGWGLPLHMHTHMLGAAATWRRLRACWRRCQLPPHLGACPAAGMT